MFGRRQRKPEIQVVLLDVHIDDGHARLRLCGLGRPRADGEGLSRRGFEVPHHLLPGGGRVHVAHDRQRHVVRVIPSPVEVHDALARQRLDGLAVADHRPAVRVAAEGQLEQFGRRARAGRILAALPFLHDDLQFLVQLAGVEGRIANGVGEHAQAVRKMPGRYDDVVNRVVRGGERVDRTARRFDFPGNGAHRTAGRALEQHVFVHVRGAGHVRRLVRAAGLDPHLHRHDRREAVFLNRDLQPVVEREEQAGGVRFGGSRSGGRERGGTVRHGAGVSHKPVAESIARVFDDVSIWKFLPPRLCRGRPLFPPPPKQGRHILNTFRQAQRTQVRACPSPKQDNHRRSPFYLGTWVRLSVRAKGPPG